MVCVPDATYYLHTTYVAQVCLYGLRRDTYLPILFIHVRAGLEKGVKYPQPTVTAVSHTSSTTSASLYPNTTTMSYR